MNSSEDRFDNTRRRSRGLIIRIAGIIAILAFMAGAAMTFSRPAVHAAAGDWTTYLENLGRDGFNGSETTLNPGTASRLRLHWTHHAAAQIVSEPVEANGLLYWGSSDGLEHATNPATGSDVWAANLGQTRSCLNFPMGVVSTANITSVPINGVTTSVDFVGGGNGQLYALNASTGAIIWHTPLGASPSHFLYSSPAVFNGSIYMGVSSFNDCPLVQGQMVQLNASTGGIQHVFNVVPNGCVGGGVWGSPTIDVSAGRIFFATGNGQCNKGEPLSTALVSLHASDLSFISAWQVPASQRLEDGDFGSTPTLFRAAIGGIQHTMIGLVNKNGIYYAFDRSHISAGPLWQVRVALPGDSPDSGNGSIAPSSYDNTHLFVAGGVTTINGSHCAGSLRELNPASGAFLWQACLSADVLGAVVTSPGLVVVAAGSTMSVLNSATGSSLFTFHDTNANATFWSAATITHGMIYIGSVDDNLYAFGL
jgi:polyvinyl alcohol dehydrogenase (cytochrome)